MSTIILDTPESISFFTLCTLRGALRLEVAGMKRRGASALKEAKTRGFKAKTAKEALELVCAEIEKTRPI